MGEGRLNPEWWMANWVNFQMNSKEKEDKGKREENVCKVEKEDQKRKEKDNGRKSSVAKLRSKKMESNPKERPKPPSKETNLKSEGRKERVNWPKANSSEWIKFDEEVSSLLKSVHSSYENKAETEPRTIYTIGN